MPIITFPCSGERTANGRGPQTRRNTPWHTFKHRRHTTAAAGGQTIHRGEPCIYSQMQYTGQQPATRRLCNFEISDCLWKAQGKRHCAHLLFPPQRIVTQCWYIRCDGCCVDYLRAWMPSSERRREWWFAHTEREIFWRVRQGICELIHSRMRW